MNLTYSSKYSIFFTIIIIIIIILTNDPTPWLYNILFGVLCHYLLESEISLLTLCFLLFLSKNYLLASLKLQSPHFYEFTVISCTKRAMSDNTGLKAFY